MADEKEIARQEGALTWVRIGELDDDPVQGDFDAAHLREIHRRIFQDLPHYAPGEYRPEAPAHIKARGLEAGVHRYYVHYAHRSKVDAGIEKVLSDFGGPDTLRNLDAETFSQRMSKLYADLDYLHPFREGNSRTLRAFTAQLARAAGYELNWGNTNVDAFSRDRLYIARDKEVTMRAFPGLDEKRAMTTESRSEFEAYVFVLARFKDADTLQQIIKESHRPIVQAVRFTVAAPVGSAANESPDENTVEAALANYIEEAMHKGERIEDRVENLINIVADAEAVQSEQRAMLDGASIEQTYEATLANYAEAMHNRVARLEDRLENLFKQQEARVQQTKENAPGMFSLPGKKRAWRAKSVREEAKLQTLHNCLEVVREIRKGTDPRAPRIEELATRRMRAKNPELASSWDAMRLERKKQEKAEKSLRAQQWAEDKIGLKEEQPGHSHGRGRGRSLSLRHPR